MMKRRAITATEHRQSGFTLIEVLVAVSIVGIALPALLFSMMQRLDSTAYMRERMIASWVAVNVLTEMQIQNLEDGRIPARSQDGEEEMADRLWGWQLEIEETTMPHHYKAEVRVWREDLDDRRVLTSMIGYVHDFETLMSEYEDESGK